MLAKSACIPVYSPTRQTSPGRFWDPVEKSRLVLNGLAKGARDRIHMFSWHTRGGFILVLLLLDAGTPSTGQPGSAHVVVPDVLLL